MLAEEALDGAGYRKGLGEVDVYSKRKPETAFNVGRRRRRSVLRSCLSDGVGAPEKGTRLFAEVG